MKHVRIGSKSIDLGKRIGRGGEGDVHLLSNHPKHVVKIYKPGIRKEREEKVRAMVTEGLARSTDLVAFPNDVAFDHSGQFVGFTMKLVGGYSPIHELYSPKSRRFSFPTADYRFLIHAAGNMARAIANVHKSGCVIGDLNHSGVLVSKEATVALIDADSFQFATSQKLFPCVVGVPDFTPPELHGLSLSTVKRTLEHDHFGLAVAIFHLLLMGRHPYAGVYSGADLSLSEAIEQNRFAFSRVRKNETKTIPPPGSMTLDDLHPPVSDAFEAAFGLDPSKRPDAATWVALMDELGRSLNRCSFFKTHFYPSAVGKCIWCRISDASGFDMFPDLSTDSARPTFAPSTDISGILRALSALELPSMESLIPSIPIADLKASKAVSEAKQEVRGKKFLGVLILIGAAAMLFVAPQFWWVWGIIAWIGFGRLAESIDTTAVSDAMVAADNRAQLAVGNFLKSTGVEELYSLKSQLDSMTTEYAGLSSGLQKELARLVTTRQERQKSAFLDRFLIRRASISGIGPAKTATLASFGIETAADLTKSAVMRVPGFGDVMTTKLLNWRKNHEVRFRYNPTPDASDKQAEDSVRAKYASRKSDLEMKIRKGHTDLSNGITRLSAATAQAKSNSNLKSAFQARAQAAKDMESLGLSVSAFTYKASRPISSVGPRSGASSQPRATIRSSTSSVPSCPRCGSTMVRRMARRGSNAGNYFWGCSRYPRCKGTRN